jgi:hypothetical protein
MYCVLYDSLASHWLLESYTQGGSDSDCSAPGMHPKRPSHCLRSQQAPSILITHLMIKTRAPLCCAVCHRSSKPCRSRCGLLDCITQTPCHSSTLQQTPMPLALLACHRVSGSTAEAALVLTSSAAELPWIRGCCGGSVALSQLRLGVLGILRSARQTTASHTGRLKTAGAAPRPQTQMQSTAA